MLTTVAGATEHGETAESSCGGDMGPYNFLPVQPVKHAGDMETGIRTYHCGFVLGKVRAKPHSSSRKGSSTRHCYMKGRQLSSKHEHLLKSFQSLTVVRLRRWLKDRGHAFKGNRAQLLQNVLEAVQA